MNKMNVESFNMDHTQVSAPYIRIASTTKLCVNCSIVKYDVRFKQPNEEQLDIKVAHSLEHFIAEYLRNYLDTVIDVSPMGCLTGFYVLTNNASSIEDFCNALEAALLDTINAVDVPAANPVQCGSALLHDLSGAKKAAEDFLLMKPTWLQVQK